MEKMRIAKNDVYVIEVNDDGETIEFDLQDILSLYRRYNAAVEGVTAAMDGLNKSIEEYNATRVDGVDEDGITPAQLKFLEDYERAFKAMRASMDLFLGNGGCQKIFGDRNYLEMWSDLFEALEPHVEKMGIQSEGIRERIKAKYSKPDEGVLKG